MGKAGMAAAKIAKALESRIMKALDGIAGVVDDGKRAEMEDAIVAALKDFERAHPLRVTVREIETSDTDKREGFFRCTVRAHRPSLEE